jgi:hypothetical protein
LATAGRPEPELPPPPVGPLVAMAVGKTKEGESLPAKPGRSLLLQTRLDASIVGHTKLRVSRTAAGKGQYAIAAGGRQAAGSLLVHDNGGSLGRHLCGCSLSGDKDETGGGVAASSKLCGPGVEACSSERWDGMALVDVGCARTRQGGRVAGTAPLRPWRACRSASGMAGKVWGCCCLDVLACSFLPVTTDVTRCCTLLSAKPRRAPMLPWKERR